MVVVAERRASEYKLDFYYLESFLFFLYFSFGFFPPPPSVPSAIPFSPSPLFSFPLNHYFSPYRLVTLTFFSSQSIFYTFSLLSPTLFSLFSSGFGSHFPLLPTRLKFLRNSFPLLAMLLK